MLTDTSPKYDYTDIDKIQANTKAPFESLTKELYRA